MFENFYEDCEERGRATTEILIKQTARNSQKSALDTNFAIYNHCESDF